MRQLVATAIVALIVSVVASATVGVLAQSPGATAVTPGLNADMVDGRHAVKATSKRSARANKLVAADAQGFLPSNIVKAKWGLITGIPGGFADGVDDVGYVSATQPSTFEAASGVEMSAFADTHIGTDVELTIIPEAGRHLEVTGEHFWRGPENPGGPYPDLPSGMIRHEIVLINSDFATPVAFKVRTRVYNAGIAPAAFRKAVETLRVTVTRAKDRR